MRRIAPITDRLGPLGRRLRALAWAPSVADEVDEELAFHLEMRTREYQGRGMGRAEACAAALQRFGDVRQVHDTCRSIGRRRERAVRHSEWFGELRQDVRYALRQLAKSPSFTLVALLTLALGTGANTSIFSVVNGVLLRPLPFPDEPRLQLVYERTPEADERSLVSIANFFDYRSQTRAFASMGAAAFRSYDLTGAAEPDQLRAFQVSDGFFATLGTRPLLGRFFTDAEARDAGATVAVLSHELWQRQFGGDSAVVGRTATLDGRPMTVIGVTRPGERFPDFADLYTPLGPGPTDRGARSTAGAQVVARLAPGATAAQAARELDLVGRRLAAAYPKENAGVTAHLVSLREDKVGETRPRLLLLLGASACVLLAACTNLSHMLLARGAQRQREIAVRVALGATRARIARQLVTESMVLALAGGTLGLLLTRWLLPALLRLTPDYLPRKEEVALDPTVTAFSLLVAVVTGVLFGALPAVRASRPDVMDTIKGSAGAGGGRGGWRTRSALVVSEVALATMLFIGAGLLLKSFARLQQVALGFDPRPVVTLGLVLPENVYASGEARAQFFRDVRERIGALPDVAAVGATNAPPFSWHPDARVTPLGVSGAPREPQTVPTQVVTAGFLEALRVPLLRGRALGDDEAPDGEPVVLVNETLARRFFGAADPVGRQLRLQGYGPPEDARIVGVVADFRSGGRDSEVLPEVFRPYTQDAWGYMTLVVRTRGRDPAAVLPSIRAAVAAVDPVRPLFSVIPMTWAEEREGAAPRFTALLVSAFAGLAALLACVGIAGVMTFAVAARSREIGIRMALGARGRDVLLLMVRPGALLVALGIALGGAASLALTALMRSLLFGVSASDPAVFAAAALSLAAVGTLACYLPTRRATSIQPVTALRSE